jgi:hypothetical protein
MPFFTSNEKQGNVGVLDMVEPGDLFLSESPRHRRYQYFT